jgi:hypothetical protein
MARKHRRKAVSEAGQQVPIQVEVLRAAMEVRQWGPSELVRATGDSQQTISALVNSRRPDRRCRVDRARRIAKALQVPFEWLTEGIVVPAIYPLVWPGYEFRYSTRTELAASRLFTLCTQACLRDLARAPLLARAGYSIESLVGQLIGLVAELVQVGRWRHWLLSWNPESQKRRGYTEPATDHSSADRLREFTEAHPGAQLPADLVADAFKAPPTPQHDENHEQAVVSLCRAIEHVLTPWFADEAKLNYDALYRLTALPAVVPVHRVDPYTPTAALPNATPRQKTTSKPTKSPAKRRTR